jgi:hypothetical protein
MAELCAAADATRAAISGHMAREEALVLPLLQARTRPIVNNIEREISRKF